MATLIESLPGETSCAPTIADLRLPLENEQSWSLYLVPGVECRFTVLGAGNPVVKLAAAGSVPAMQPMAAPAPLGVQGGGSSGAFLLDDPSGFFSDGATPNG